MYKLVTFPITSGDELVVSCFTDIEKIKETVISKTFNGMVKLEEQEKDVVNKFITTLFALPNIYAGMHPQSFRDMGTIQIIEEDCISAIKSFIKNKDKIFVISNINVYYIEEVMEVSYNYWMNDMVMYDKITTLTKTAARKLIIDEILSVEL